MLDKDTVLMALTSPVLYSERLVYAIGKDLRVRLIESFSELTKTNNDTIKIEGMERLFKSVYETARLLANRAGHVGPCTCHLFWANEKSPSFDTHTDPCDVYLKIISGIKTMEIDGECIDLLPSSEPYRIPANTPHRALNEYASMMLSYSTESFLEDRLW